MWRPFRQAAVGQQAAKQFVDYIALAWTHGVSGSGGRILGPGEILIYAEKRPEWMDVNAQSLA